MNEQEIAIVKKALEPLANLYGMIDDQDDKPDTAMFFQHDGYTITYGDIRLALDVISGLSQSPSPD